MRVLRSYVQAASVVYAVFTGVSLVCFVAAQVGTNIWLSIWTQDPVVNGTQDQALLGLRLGVYGGLGMAQTFAVFGLAFCIALGSVSASRTLHTRLTQNILRCPMSFFDTTPLGRILNRFSKDIDILDVNLPQFAQNLMTTLAPLTSTIIVIGYTNPVMIALLVPLAIMFVVLQRVYVACARQIKRLDSIKKSPIYAFFSETLNGTSSIRAYRQQQRFMEHSDTLVDNQQSVWFEVFTSNRWIGVYAEMIGDIIVFFTALFAVIQRDSMNSGMVGLSLSFAFQMSMNLIMTVRSSCELETYIVAVERIQEYTDAPTEAPWVITEKRPPRDWPVQGSVEFKDYQTRYRKGLDLVLRGVNCLINPGEKVGIIGRTGAGKSSMTLALFRIIEAAGGCIKIDDLDIASIGLHDARTKITIIPQDPVLFTGSIRFNLDPSEHYSDEEVWAAIDHAHLKTFISSLPQRLEYECGEDGENLSVGQRQLLCLARALLRKSKILVLDEATAAVDLETDDLIQSTIRSEFKECTVLTIAHRLNTIMDYDRVMVMQEGEIKEFDIPHKLLENRQSIFFSMARDAGLA